MNSTHGLALGGGGALGAAVVGVLTEQFHMSATLASNWVQIALGVATAVGALFVWWLHWKYPNAPALPGEAVLIPEDAPAAPIAIKPANPVAAPVPAVPQAVNLPPVFVPAVPPAEDIPQGNPA